MNTEKYKNIDEYNASFSENIQQILTQLRKAIKDAAPKATEVISYGMPAFKLNKVLVYYAANKSHIGFYPTPASILYFKNELSAYKTSKGAIQFPLDKPLPLALIKKIVKFRVAQDKEKSLELKTTSKKMPVKNKKNVAVKPGASTTAAHDERVAKLTFASVYPHLVNKVESKGRTVEELHEIIRWLTGFSNNEIQKMIDNKVTFEYFFNKAKLNPNAHLITGMICGYRVEEISNPLTQKVRYLDKLVDELAKGRSMEKILRK